MYPRLLRPMLAAVLLAGAVAAPAQQGFTFSQPDDAARQEREAREARVAEQLSTPCRADLKAKKIMIVIGEERSDGRVAALQENYGPHFDAIARRLKALGLAIFTRDEIRRQIAQAEIDAQFRNDPDAALSASKRLGANFVLRGLIASQAVPNPVIRVNQVSVSMTFTLTASNGRAISTAGAHAASYAGNDVAGMALTLVEEQADEVVATLYEDYCRKAGLGAPRPPMKK